MRRMYATGWIVVSIIFALPAWAGGGDAPVRATIEKFFAAFNSGNVSAATELWTPDAVDINFSGMISGKAQLNQRIGAELKLGVKFDHKIDRIDVDGPIAWAVGQYTVTIPSKDGGSTQKDGVWLQVLKRNNGTWKLQAVSFTRVNQP